MYRFFKLSLFASMLICLCACSSLENRDCRISDIDGLPVKHAFLDSNEYNRSYKIADPFSQIKSITIHNTDGKMSAIGERDYLNSRRDNVSVSFHFTVDEKQAVQILPLNIHAWHAGDGSSGEGNLNSIAIEICRNLCAGNDGKFLYDAAENNAAILAAFLLDKYNLPMSALRKHQDWSGKYCPRRILSEGRWEMFYRKVEALRKSSATHPDYPPEKIARVEMLSDNGKIFFKTSDGKRFYSVKDLTASLTSKKIPAAKIFAFKNFGRKNMTQVLRDIRAEKIDVVSLTAPSQD